MTFGTFVPWHANPTPRQSAKIGWIIGENGCHIWQGAKNPQGYGMVRWQGRGVGAYAARYEREVGQVPKGMVLDHFVCNNPVCCNPEHMRVVTQSANLRRSVRTLAAQNVAKTHCPQGHELTPDNLDAWKLRRGNRACRACKNARIVESKRNRAERTSPTGTER